MTVSVVIPLLNSANTIGQQLEALSQQKCTDWCEVVVADNGSTDSSLDLVRTYQGKVPHLRIVDASGRRGASHARNRGVQQAQGDILVFCDARMMWWRLDGWPRWLRFSPYTSLWPADTTLRDSIRRGLPRAEAIHNPMGLNVLPFCLFSAQERAVSAFDG